MQDIFTRILSRQVTVEDDGTLDVTNAFNTLVQVFTFVATPPEHRGDIASPFDYQALLEAAKTPVLRLEADASHELDMAVAQAFGAIRGAGDLTLNVPEGMTLNAARTLALDLGGDLTVRFQGEDQVLMLSSDSSLLLNGGTLNVQNGTLNLTRLADDAFTGVGAIEIASSVVLTVPQLRALSGPITGSEDGRIEIIVGSEEEAQEAIPLPTSQKGQSQLGLDTLARIW